MIPRHCLSLLVQLLHCPRSCWCPSVSTLMYVCITVFTDAVQLFYLVVPVLWLFFLSKIPFGFSWYCAKDLSFGICFSFMINSAKQVLKWFLPARRYASVGYRDRNVSVCLSVCVSVTRRYCVKTKKAIGMISSPSGSPKTLVFRRQISSPNSKGFPPNGGLKQGSVGKIQRFFSFKRQYLENRSRYGQSYY